MQIYLEFNQEREKARIRMSSNQRLQVLNSHISGAPQQPSPMASEKDAALAAVPSDSPTMYTLLPHYLFVHWCWMIIHITFYLCHFVCSRLLIYGFPF